MAVPVVVRLEAAGWRPCSCRLGLILLVHLEVRTLAALLTGASSRIVVTLSRNAESTISSTRIMSVSLKGEPPLCSYALQDRIMKGESSV